MKKVMLLLSILINIILISLLSYYYFKSKILPNNNHIYKTKDDIQNSNKLLKNDIVFWGDSMIEFGNWSELFRNSNIINRGISGDQISTLTKRVLSTDKIENPKKIFIMIGINDINKNITQKSFSLQFSNLLTSIKSKFPTTKEVYVHSILPISKKRNKRNIDIKEFNFEIRKLCNFHKISYINIFKLYSDETTNMKPEYSFDGLHLNAKGYNIWKKSIEQYLKN